MNGPVVVLNSHRFTNTASLDLAGNDINKLTNTVLMDPDTNEVISFC